MTNLGPLQSGGSVYIPQSTPESNPYAKLVGI